MDLGRFLDTSFGRLRIQLSAVFFIISRVLAIFLAWLYTSSVERPTLCCTRSRTFPLDMWVATDTIFECSSVRFRANHTFKTTLFKMNPSNEKCSENECSKLSWGGGGGGEILIPVHARELGVEKFSRHMYFKQYFTRYEFIKGKFKPHLTLPFCKFHMSRISLSLNHAMRINSLQFFNILILDYVVSACQFVY